MRSRRPSSPEGAFPQVLREYRKKQGLTQEALAEASGLHAVTISFFEGGQRSPTLATFFRLAAALGVKPSAMIRRIEARTTDDPRPRGFPRK